MTSIEYHFEYEDFYKEITTDYDYLCLRYQDIPEAERQAIKTISPLRSVCPYTATQFETFRTMKQPSDDWLEARDKFLTTSRFPHICGDQVSRFGTSLQYWREVTGRALAPPFTEKQMGYVTHGTKNEPRARKFYEHLFGVPVNEEGLRVLQQAPWIYSASSDGLRNNNPKRDGIIEIKCNAVGEARDGVPHHYEGQMMGAMAVYEAPFCDFVNYWTRPGISERFFYCCRVYWDAEYWRIMKIRLDYMAWCIANGRAPTGMGEIIYTYPLPPVRKEVLKFCMIKGYNDEEEIDFSKIGFVDTAEELQRDIEAASPSLPLPQQAPQGDEDEVNPAPKRRAEEPAEASLAPEDQPKSKRARTQEPFLDDLLLLPSPLNPPTDTL